MKHKKIITGLAIIIILGLSQASFAATKEELKEIMATILNLNGHLCAKVTSIKPLTLDNHFEVSCIEYRGGSKEVTYIFNAEKGTAFKQ